VDFRVCNGGDATADEVPMRLEGGMARALHGATVQTLDAFRGQPVHALAGIGHPERFFDDLRARGIEVLAHPFPDHHAYAPGELDFGDSLPVLMTEKDAVKCAAFAPPQSWAVPVRAVLPEAFFDAVAAKLVQARRAS